MAYRSVTPPEASEALENDPAAVYLDVRTAEEFEAGHPAGARNVPVLLFDSATRQAAPNPDFLPTVEKHLPRSTVLLVGCQSGVRSRRACDLLTQAGYQDVRNVDGGFRPRARPVRPADRTRLARCRASRRDRSDARRLLRGSEKREVDAIGGFELQGGMPPALILHHYDTSPFSEKVRKLFAHKRLAWRAVEQPTIMPKPELVPLTGGYRRIPVLQIGADVYCDTQLIARVLERLHPEPTIYPGGSEGTCHAWNLWADRLLFLPVVAIVFAEIGHMVPAAFIEDRSKMMPGRDFGELPRQAPHAREAVRALLTTLETQLADGRPWLLGRDFSLADAACHHPIWFTRVAPGAASLVAESPRLRAWTERVDALGNGEPSPLEPAAALAIAKESRPATTTGVDPREPNGLALGSPVSVVPDDYGFDPVSGELVHSSAHEVAVRRIDPTLGEVVVHFPRIGFRITPRDQAPTGT